MQDKLNELCTIYKIDSTGRQLIEELIRGLVPGPKQARFMDSTGGEIYLSHVDKYAKGWNGCRNKILSTLNTK